MRQKASRSRTCVSEMSPILDTRCREKKPGQLWDFNPQTKELVKVELLKKKASIEMQFKLLVVNNRNQCKCSEVNSVWLVIQVEKLAMVNLPLPIWIDYHY